MQSLRNSYCAIKPHARTIKLVAFRLDCNGSEQHLIVANALRSFISTLNIFLNHICFKYQCFNL